MLQNKPTHTRTVRFPRPLPEKEWHALKYAGPTEQLELIRKLGGVDSGWIPIKTPNRKKRYAQ